MRPRLLSSTITLIKYTYKAVCQVFKIKSSVSPERNCEIQYLFVNPGDEVCAEYQLGNHESWGRAYPFCATVELK